MLHCVSNVEELRRVVHALVFFLSAIQLSVKLHNALLQLFFLLLLVKSLGHIINHLRILIRIFLVNFTSHVGLLHNLALHLLKIDLSVFHKLVDLLLLLLKGLKHQLQRVLVIRLLRSHHWLWLLLDGIHVLLGSEHLLLDVVHLLLDHRKRLLNVRLHLVQLIQLSVR
jgi:hypothetical protein